MRILVQARPGSSKESIEEVEEGTFRVWVKVPPIKGMANRAILKVLAKHFKIAESQVNIISGRFSRNKVIKIDN